MNIGITALVLVGLAGVWVLDVRVVKLNPLAWLATWWAALYVFLRFGIDPPLPSSLVGMFMAIISLALLTYLTASTERLEAARRVVVRFIVDDTYLIPLVLVVLLLPALVALQVYNDVTERPQPPVSGRTIHPPPPASIQFDGETINLATAVNPYRELEQSDPAAFAEHVDNGRRVYYENCVYCHGDDMRGEGMFAHGYDPLPANFQDSGTIAQLQESYLFWRIAKGGPDLPDESAPWASAMPAWEDFLTEEEIWDVILFLYEYTDHRPRARETIE